MLDQSKQTKRGRGNKQNIKAAEAIEPSHDHITRGSRTAGQPHAPSVAAASVNAPTLTSVTSILLHESLATTAHNVSFQRTLTSRKI